MTSLAPFVVEPLLKERVWGGARLGQHDPPFGEAWIVSEQSPIGSGPFSGMTLAEAVAAEPLELLGRRVFDTEGAVFPLLIKLLDPADWLSIQVHPDDALAIELEGPGFRGKTEAWYVLEADPGAELIAGVRPGIANEDVIEVIRNGSLEVLLERHPVREGDALLVEAGLIHALGPGLFIYEVQQSSDLTYRVSDWGRPAGAGRALHIEQSARAAKLELRPQFAPMVKRLPNGSFPVLSCEYFALELVDSDGVAIERDTEDRSFAAVTVIEGSAVVATGGDRLTLGRYESAIVPAACGPYVLEGSGSFRALVSSVP
ncbi:MAG TPA: type I phosphomannose isomerase catalytic subunit [Thermomicrobiales bacterium]|nr:type I phosphomannose isomerase catalytic subunit [Thermomicrobiales bacterium]